MRCEEPDRVPFLEAWIGERISLALLGRPQPEERPAEEKESGDGTATRGPVHTGMRPISSPYYEPIEVVQTLELDGFGASLSIQGVQRNGHGHYLVAGQPVKTRADLAHVRLPDPDDPDLYEPLRRFVAQYRDTGLALFCRVSPGASALIFGLGLESCGRALYDDRPMIEDLFEM